MMKLILIMTILLVAVPSYAVIIKLNDNPIEIGQPLVDPLTCLQYRGRTSSGVALYAEGCDGRSNGWLYLGPTGFDYHFYFNGTWYFLRGVGNGRNQVDQYYNDTPTSQEIPF